MPDKPNGWSCTLAYSQDDPAKSVYICNRMENPDESAKFLIHDPAFKNAHCMDLESFRGYTDYVFKLRNELMECRTAK